MISLEFMCTSEGMLSRGVEVATCMIFTCSSALSEGVNSPANFCKVVLCVLI